MTNEIVAQFQVPQTTTVISVYRVTTTIEGKTCHYLAQRLPGTNEPLARTGNFLEAGRSTEAEAREVANFLWTDAVARRNTYDALNASPRQSPAAPKPEITEGVWRMPEGTIYKVQTSRGYGDSAGAGKLYGKRLMVLPETERYIKTVRGVKVEVKAELVYEAAVPAKLRNAYAVKLDDTEAAKVGSLSGVCMFCGRDLTDERSTTAGYGPDCAKKRGLPWGEAAPIIDLPTSPANEN
jgi:hypothetical protein